MATLKREGKPITVKEWATAKIKSGDWYTENIGMGALNLKAADYEKYSNWTYYTQYAGGSTVWQSPDKSATVLITYNGEIRL